MKTTLTFAVLGVLTSGCFSPVDMGSSGGGIGGHGGGSTSSAGGGSAGGSAGGGSGGGATSGCTYGADETCNDNPAMGSIAGHCGQESGLCSCLTGYELNPATGKCRSSAVLNCMRAGDVTPCTDLAGASVTGFCAPDRTCYCSSGYVHEASTGRCKFPVPQCSVGGVSCQGNLMMSAQAGFCTPIGSGDGCSCSNGFDTKDPDGKCYPAGVDGGVTTYALKDLGTNIARIELQRDDVFAQQCAIVTVAQPSTSAYPRVSVANGPSPGTWVVERIRYVFATCSHAMDPGVATVPAEFASGNLTFSNATGTTSATLTVAAFFPQDAGVKPPSAMRFLARDVR